jgi:hypothetical protein
MSAELGIKRSQVGALSELRACVDLLQRGYSVFRSVGPHAECDLLTFRGDGPILRVEVKTGYDGATRVYAPKGDPARYDVRAIVTTTTVHYEPEGIIE